MKQTFLLRALLVGILSGAAVQPMMGMDEKQDEQSWQQVEAPKGSFKARRSHSSSPTTTPSSKSPRNSPTGRATSQAGESLVEKQDHKIAELKQQIEELRRLNTSNSNDSNVENLQNQLVQMNADRNAILANQSLKDLARELGKNVPSDQKSTISFFEELKRYIDLLKQPVPNTVLPDDNTGWKKHLKNPYVVAPVTAVFTALYVGPVRGMLNACAEGRQNEFVKGAIQLVAFNGDRWRAIGSGSLQVAKTGYGMTLGKLVDFASKKLTRKR